jgi:outer membrane immunogenic protein
MRFAQLAWSAVIALAAVGPASAADLPVRMPVKAPIVKPAYNWSGFYIGGHAGYAWGREAINVASTRPGDPADFVDAALATGIYPGSLASDPRGFLGGLTWGTNWQIDRWVLGLESDISFGKVSRSETVNTLFFPFGGPVSVPVQSFGEQELTWLSTTRARLGYTVTDNLLFFGTGGLANGRAEVSNSNTVAVGSGFCTNVGGCLAGSDSKILWGWAAGAGIEYGIGRWSLKVEYLHYDLGKLNYTYTDTAVFPPSPPGSAVSSTRFAGDIVRAGLNYRFDWTPWQLVFGR